MSREAVENLPEGDGRPRICQVLHGLTVGGAEVLASRLARYLRDRFMFSFVCLDCCGTLGEELQAEGFSVVVVNRRPGLDWRCAWRLRREIRVLGTEVIHAHQYTPFVYAALARTLQPRVPIVFTEHGRWFPDYPRSKRILANRFLLGRGDQVVGVGNSVRQALVNNEGIRPDRVRVIHNGIDINEARRHVKTIDRREVRREAGYGDADLLVIHVARFDYLKDHNTAVRAMERIAYKDQNVHLAFVGDGPELPFVQSKVKQLGLEGRIKFLGLRQDVTRLLIAADILLLTSISEGIPLTILEGMAANLPVVATAVGGVQEVVEADITGLLASAGDDERLCNAILHLARHPGQRHAMGDAGRARVERYFNEKLMCDAYTRLYEDMLHA